MKYYYLFMLFTVAAFCPGIAPGQSRQYSAMVIDAESSVPLANVNIVIQETLRGTKTDNNGLFTLRIENDQTLVFSHVAYEPFKMKINDKNPLEIRLKRKVSQLAPLTITAPAPEDLIGNKPYFIIDYEFSGNNLLMLGFNNSEFDPRLFLAHKDGTIITAVSVMRPEQLFRDCMGNVFLITKSTAYEIRTDGKNVELIFPVARDEFFAIYSKLAGHSTGHYFLKDYYNGNKSLVYYNYIVADSSYNELSVIEDKDAIQRARWGGYFHGHEEDVDFMQRIINKPVYAPLLVIHDTIYIFNYLSQLIEKYLPDGTLEVVTPMDYGNESNFRKEMCLDAETGKVYALFLKNGISSIREVDCKTGKTVNSLSIPNYVYIDEIKVNDGNLFFLYKENKSDGFKKLYRMKIDS